MATLGGVKDSPASNSADVDSLARFAIDEHNKKEVSLVFDSSAKSFFMLCLLNHVFSCKNDDL